MTTVSEILNTDFLSVDVKDSVSRLLGKMKQKGMHYALVFDGNKYLGVVDKRFLLSSRIDPSVMKVGNILKKRSKAKSSFFVPLLKSSTDLKEACRLMCSSDSHVLPVVEKEKVLGVVFASDILSAIADEYKNVVCEQFASLPLTLSPDDGVDKAINLFVKKGVDHLPVVEKNRLVGMLGLSDLLDNTQGVSAQKLPSAASHQKGKHSGYYGNEKTSMLRLPVSNFINKNPLCCIPSNTKVSEASKRMLKQGVCSIIIVKDEFPIGILTVKDILRDFAK